MLRFSHKENVTYLRERLFDAGIAAQHTPSHIIPIHVSFNFWPKEGYLKALLPVIT